MDVMITEEQISCKHAVTECVKLRLGPPQERAVLTPCGTACVLYVFSADERVYIDTTFYRVLLFSTTPPVLESKMRRG